MAQVQYSVHAPGHYTFRCRVLIRIAINNETEVLFTVYSRSVTPIAMCAIETNTSSSWYNRQKRIARDSSGSRERVHSGIVIRNSVHSTVPKPLLDHAIYNVPILIMQCLMMIRIMRSTEKWLIWIMRWVLHGRKRDPDWCIKRDWILIRISVGSRIWKPIDQKQCTSTSAGKGNDCCTYKYVYGTEPTCGVLLLAHGHCKKSSTACTP